jgi:hypothetical protein
MQLAMLASVQTDGEDGIEIRTPSSPIVTRAEIAPCTCPDFCERDHEFD